MATIKSKNQKSPNIFRFIPELNLFRKEKIWLYSTVTTVLLAGIAYIGWQAYENINQVTKIQIQRKEAEHQVSYWENVVKEHPNYRDAYFTLALLEYQLGNSANARSYLDKTFYIDPNFEEGRKLERLLNRR